MLSRRRPGMPVQRALLAICLLLALQAGSSAAAKTPGEVEVGQVLREATLLGLNGKSRQLSEFRGRPLIINVWASWCGPCRAETASLERLAWVDAPAGVTIIGISTDDDAQAARSWLRSSNATLSHFIDRRLEMEHMLGADKLPLTVLVDAEGRVLRKVYGAQQWDSPQARRLISDALREGAGGASRSAARPPAR